MISTMAGVKLSHVPYSTTQMTDVIAGHLPVTMDPATTAVPMINSGKAKAIAVTSAKRMEALPNRPLNFAAMSQRIQRWTIKAVRFWCFDRVFRCVRPLDSTFSSLV
jgi:hypothetical protein